VLQDVLELLPNHLNDFALVDNTIQGVSHFVRNGRVDQRKQLALSSRGIVENLLGDVNEADHYLSIFALSSFDFTFFHLVEFEFWNVFVVDSLH